MKSEKWSDAINLLADQIRLVRNDWKLSWNLGWCYFKLHRFDEALKHMKRAVKLSPSDPVSNWGLGAVYLHKGNYTNAEKFLVFSLSLGEAYTPRLCLALTYLKQGKLDEAENVYLQGIKLRPKYRSLHEAYADFLSDVGREKEALKVQKRAAKLRSNV